MEYSNCLNVMKTIIVLTLFFTATVTSANVPFEGKQAVVTAEFIYLQDEVAFPSCHASTIAETSEDVARGLAARTKPRRGIWFSRQENGTWTDPRLPMVCAHRPPLSYRVIYYGDELFCLQGGLPKTSGASGHLCR